MIPLFGPILQAIGSGFSSWQDGRTKIKAAKIAAEVAKWESEAKIQMMKVDGEINWDIEALRQSKYSWKDEYLMVILSAPFIGSFIPNVQDYVLKGWEYIGKAPAWYQAAFIGVVAATFGLRWWFKQKGLGG